MNPNETIFQSDYYAAYLKTLGINFNQVGVGLDSRLVYFKSSPLFGWLYGKKASEGVHKKAQEWFPCFHWIGGPVATEDGFGFCLMYAAKRALKLRIPITSAIPPILDDKPEIFRNLGFTSQPRATLLIDLTQLEEALWENVDKAVRKTVRRTQEKGVAVREITTDEEFDGYAEVVNESRKRAGVNLYDPQRMKSGRNCLGEVAHVFVAEKDNEILAGLMITEYNGWLHEWGAGTSNKAIQEKIYANDLLKWEIIKWGAQRGNHYYDLCGVSPEPKDAKEQGIYRFKEKWGGKLVHYNEYKLDVNRKRDKLIDLARWLK